MTTAEANGAAEVAAPNVSRPRTYRTSAPVVRTRSCHHADDDRTGTRHTTVTPARAVSRALVIQEAMVRPYGGFIHTAPPLTEASSTQFPASPSRRAGSGWSRA